jgi:hypothetical protein
VDMVQVVIPTPRIISHSTNYSTVCPVASLITLLFLNWHGVLATYTCSTMAQICLRLQCGEQSYENGDTLNYSEPSGLTSTGIQTRLARKRMRASECVG